MKTSEHWRFIILGSQLLPLATIKLMGDNKEFNNSAIFWGVLFSVGGGNLQIIEDSSLVTLDYQLLPIATSMLMGDNKEFNNSAIFWGVLFIVGGGNLQNIKDFSICDLWLPIVAPSNH